ncbi:MAG: hypothetical protein V2I50_10430 [Desulfuromusa sp.]|jgi:hypothetical protein|nr:hypothetical protein [Desulfuromusa sp.]
MKKTVLIISALLVVLSLSACQTTTTFYLGAKADEEGVINLATAQTGQQLWQDLYVTVDYNLSTSGNILDIDGALSFSDSPRINFTGVRDLKLKLFLLDQNMRVVEYFDIARTLSTNLDDQTIFSKTMKIKSDAVAMTFGYEGSFVDSEPEGSGQIVWKLPKRDTN